MIQIQDGLAKIQTGTFKFIHEIDYDRFLQDIRLAISEDIPRTNAIFPTLKIELEQNADILNSIKRIHLDRQRRSLDILGTTWKYLDGYPDHNDLEMITKALGDLSENSKINLS